MNCHYCHHGDSVHDGRGCSKYLGDTELAGSQLPLHLLHLLVALRLSALQLFAALHHRPHLRLHLTDVETGHSELLINQTAALLLLMDQENTHIVRSLTN